MGVWQIGVFPAEVKDPSVAEKAGMPVVLLIDRQLPDRAVVVQSVSVRDVRFS